MKYVILFLIALLFLQMWDAREERATVYHVVERIAVIQGARVDTLNWRLNELFQGFGFHLDLHKLSDPCQ